MDGASTIAKLSCRRIDSRTRDIRGGSRARKRGVLILCSKTTPISKPHPLIINTLYCMTSSQLIKILQSDWSVAMQ